VSDDDDREREEHRQKLEARLKKMQDEAIKAMMGSMVEAMAPMLGGSQLLGDEAKAWDDYVVAYVGAFGANHDASGVTDQAFEAGAVEFANRILDERRKLFNEETFKERMRGMLPSGRGLCNKPILRNDGTDSGHRCTQNDGHGGICF
jgi:hypothetical protein